MPGIAGIRHRFQDTPVEAFQNGDDAGPLLPAAAGVWILFWDKKNNHNIQRKGNAAETNEPENMKRRPRRVSARIKDALFSRLKGVGPINSTDAIRVARLR